MPRFLEFGEALERDLVHARTFGTGAFGDSALGFRVAILRSMDFRVAPEAVNLAIKAETQSEKISDNFAQRDAPVCKDFSQLLVEMSSD
ncbi:hypothetical protein L596_014096 [Steinernema carpocapsae]|uniref:Uncharacterized protein n=1 Tax=Steinernema carpocapsae TaxID=34508 RepID=A0A4U5NBQ3_STECR|nr:hypothetical protein L596_014096 [Steinernema carpocapsae]